MCYPPPVRSDPRRPGPFPNLRLPALTAACGLLLAAVVAPTLAAEPASAFRIYVEEPGVYRVTHEELRAAGLAAEVDSRGLAVTRGGEQVPIWVVDGGDGRFGPGDRIELVGEHLRGHRSTFNEHTRLNVYRLAVGGPAGGRMSTPPVPAEAANARAPLAFEEHLEKDRIKEIFARPGAEIPEIWFWTRLTHVDPEPFRQFLRLQGHLADSERPVSVAVQLQGWSNAARQFEGLTDHRVEVTLNDVLVGTGEWNGHDSHLIEIEAPSSLVRPGQNVLELRVPERRPPEPPADASDPPAPIIDAVTLNWIELRYPRGTKIGSQPLRLFVDGGVEAPGPTRVRLTTDPGARLVVYGGRGSRFDHRNTAIEELSDRRAHDVYLPAEETALWAVPEGTLRPTVAVEADRPSDLRSRSQQADYIIITHPRLRPAIEPLADFHRRRGLAVTVVEVDDVYDEFSHSILDPTALREFLSHAYHHWRRPAPRFVLLVGDAGWKAEQSVFSAEIADPVALAGDSDGDGDGDGGGVTRIRHNLVPTGAFHSMRGLAASDNYFVAVDGDDRLPDMAIGRFPATEPEEVEAIVAKTVRYSNEPVVGPWRRKILWISSADDYLQERSDLAVGSVAERGFELRKLYPGNEVEANEQSQEGLQQALDQGQLLVHFLGHGGRFIWRTGVTSYQTTLDLFTVDHFDQLAPNPRLPLILGMTCYNASFSHPTADSFGERLLRLEGRGAVAFLGASWKIGVDSKFSELLVEELTSGGTIGEAIQRAKRRILSPSPISIYNLLGDPALELALPQLAVEVTARVGDGEGWTIDAAVPGGEFTGRALVDWLDGAGEVVRSDELEVRHAVLTADGPAAGAAVEAVRVYVWDDQAGVDGIGALRLVADPG